MKDVKKFLFVLVLISLVGCSKDSTINQPEPSGFGIMSMKIDRQNAPQDIYLIIATLTRSGFQTITSNMSLLTDSSASTTINELESGTWHLKVDALNANNVLVYTGETDVSISAGATTNVTLQLIPTGNNFGQINILVTWGTSTKNWIDYPSNPILIPSNNYYDFGGVIQSMVYRTENKYIMWYDGVVNNGIKFVLYAESQDGFNWSKPISHPVIYPNPNSWDSWAVHPGPVIRENGIFKMYYNSGSSQNGLWHIGLASSVDGISWEKSSSPVISTDYLYWAPQIIAWSIVKNDGIYYLFFTGRDHPYYKIGLATSIDRINWTKRTDPIMVPTLIWEGTGVASPSVIFENGLFTMVYSNVNPTYNAFGYATSIDGINWTKKDTPFFHSTQTANQWSPLSIAYPCYNNYNGQKRIYYTGQNVTQKIGVIQYK